MSGKLSRREWLTLTASSVPAARWVFGFDGAGNIVRAASKSSASWKPIFFSKRSAEAIANLAEAVLPRTDTPGARDARVHEYIDLAFSVSSDSIQERFLDRLKWMEKRTKRIFGTSIAKLSSEECVELLTPFSDALSEHPDELKEGVSFLRDLKTRTIFGYYTSLEGRVQELGLPPEVGMETWQGCTHAEGEH